MKKIPLTKGYAALVDDEDFERVKQFKWTAAVRNTATYTRVYGYRMVNRCAILLHRFILDLSPRDDRDVDHEDHNGLNCQKYNLRISTRSQNLGGMRKRSGTSSKYKGVSKTPTSWASEIMCGGKRTRKAGFKTEEDAALFYNAQAMLKFGEFAHLNSV